MKTSAPKTSPQKNSRREARSVALQILYRLDLDRWTGDAQELARAIAQHFEHFQVEEDSREFVSTLVSRTWLKKAELDAILEKYSQSWRIERMPLIDRNLIRMAIEEMRSFQDIPAKATLNEAIEIAKVYGSEDSAKFTNGILDSFYQSLPEKKE